MGYTLYRHYDSSGHLLYVGLTNEPPRRLRQHRSGKPWWDEVTRTTYDHSFASLEAVTVAEVEAIKAERPTWNIKHNGNGNVGSDKKEHVTVAEQKWPTAAWVMGHGSYASVAHCRALTVMLFATHVEAAKAKNEIDRMGCGGFCVRRHEIVHLSEPKSERMTA